MGEAEVEAEVEVGAEVVEEEVEEGVAVVEEEEEVMVLVDPLRDTPWVMLCFIKKSPSPPPLMLLTLTLKSRIAKSVVYAKSKVRLGLPDCCLFATWLTFFSLENVR